MAAKIISVTLLILFSGVFTIAGGGEAKSRVFTIKAEEHDFNLTLDNGTVTGRKVL